MVKVAEDSMGPSCFGVHIHRDHSNIPNQPHDFEMKKSDYAMTRTDQFGGQFPFVLYQNADSGDEDEEAELVRNITLLRASGDHEQNELDVANMLLQDAKWTPLADED